MHDESTASNIYCHLLSAISVIARDCLGLAGVVLLFDEAETVDQAASRLNVQRGLNLLRALQLVSANDPRLLTERFTWDGTSFQLGEGTGLRYSGRRSSLSYEPLRFSVAQPVALKTAFAFVPSDFLENEEISAEELYLEPLGEEALSNALRAALDEYSKAYEYVIPPSQWALLAHRLESLRASSPRQFVKAAIEAFDLARLCGYVDPDELLAV